MSKKMTMKPLAVAMGAAFVTSLAGTPVANATDNPFAMTELASGYMVAENKAMEGKCGEGKCGAGMTKEGKCGMNSMDTNGDGNITREEFMQGHEAMFDSMDTNHDGVVDGSEQDAHMKMMKEGNCGAGKMSQEGKCGAGKMNQEGKCGAEKKGAE